MPNGLQGNTIIKASVIEKRLSELRKLERELGLPYAIKIDGANFAEFRSNNESQKASARETGPRSKER